MFLVTISFFCILLAEYVSGSCSATTFYSTRNFSASGCVEAASIVVQNGADVDLSYLANLTVIYHDLIIQNNLFLIDASLPRLTKVNRIALYDNLNLALANFSGITTFLAHLEVFHNQQLKEIHLDGLQFSGQTTFQIVNNSQLEVFSSKSKFSSLDVSYWSLFVVNNSRSFHDQMYCNGTSLPPVQGIDVIAYIYISCSPSFHSFVVPGLNSLVHMVVENNQFLQTLQLNSLQQVSNSLTIRSNPAMTSLSWLAAASTINGAITIDGNSNLQSLSGLTATQVQSLSILNHPNLQSLHGLLVAGVQNDLRIENNAMLQSLQGLQYLNRILGSLSLKNNPMLSDYSSLSSSLVVLANQPAEIEACCPQYNFFQPPSLFTRSNFPCQICTQFSTIQPPTGPVTGGTLLRLSVSGSFPAPWLLFQFQSDAVANAVVNCTLQQDFYLCRSPAAASASANLPAPSSKIAVSYDIGQSFVDTGLSFQYLDWQTLLGEDLLTEAIQAQNQTSTASPTSPTPTAGTASAASLPGVPELQQERATMIQNWLIVSGGVFSGTLLLMVYVCYVCSKSKWMIRALANLDYVRLQERDFTQPIGHGVIVRRRTTVIGGMFTLLAVSMMSFLVLAYLVTVYLENESVSTNVVLSNGQSVQANTYAAQIQLIGYNGNCMTIASAVPSQCDPSLNIQVLGFAPTSSSTIQCTETAGATASAASQCNIAWSCRNCTQTLPSASFSVQSTDPNAFIRSFQWQMSVINYLNQSSLVQGTLTAGPGQVFQGSTLSNVPISVIPTRYQYYSDPITTGLVIDHGLPSAGTTVYPWQLGLGQPEQQQAQQLAPALQVQLTIQQSITWLEIVIASKASSLVVLAQSLAIASGVFKLVQLLVSLFHQRTVKSVLKSCILCCYPCSVWFKPCFAQEEKEKAVKASNIMLASIVHLADDGSHSSKNQNLPDSSKLYNIV